MSTEANQVAMAAAWGVSFDETAPEPAAAASAAAANCSAGDGARGRVEGRVQAAAACGDGAAPRAFAHGALGGRTPRESHGKLSPTAIAGLRAAMGSSSSLPPAQKASSQ